MTHAATVIQNGFRSYQEHKRFKKSQEAAVCIQNYYRNYRDHGGRPSAFSPNHLFENNPSIGLKSVAFQRRLMTYLLNFAYHISVIFPFTLRRTYSQRRQNQAARKIQQFMRQSKNR